MLWGREESKVHVPLRRHPKRMVHPPPPAILEGGETAELLCAEPLASRERCASGSPPRMGTADGCSLAPPLLARAWRCVSLSGLSRLLSAPGWRG